MESLVLHCGAPPTGHPAELYSPLFKKAPHNGQGRQLEIRTAPPPAPLFTGKLTFRTGTLSDGMVGVGLTADLCLNVNRALNHCREELAACGTNPTFSKLSGFKRGLCGNDNLAPFDLAQGEHDHARKRHIESTLAAIRADVKRAAGVAENAGSGHITVSGPWGDFSLREVETCWDIGGTGFDAVQTLADITPSLLQYRCKRGWEGNAGTMTLELSKSERLVIYAKAPDRLRFEVRHSPRNGNRNYSAATIPILCEKLDMFRNMAAQKVNHVLSFIHGPQAARQSVGQWDAYAIAWGACCGNTDAARAIFVILRNLGGILGGNAIECLSGGDKVLRKARDAGLIIHEHGAFRPVFQNIAEPALTELDNSPLFVGHNTETQTANTPRNFPRATRNGRELNRDPTLSAYLQGFTATA